ncbi:unnamed protein product, partial [marine sediment metagenome]
FFVASIVGIALAGGNIALTSIAHPLSILLIIFTARLINRWPIIEFEFNANEPYVNQVMQIVGPIAQSTLVRSGMFASMFALA